MNHNVTEHWTSEIVSRWQQRLSSNFCYTNCWVLTPSTAIMEVNQKIISCLRQNHRKNTIHFDMTCQFFPLKWWSYMGVSKNRGTPISHPKMIIFSRKIHGFVGETHHFRKHPYFPGTFVKPRGAVSGKARSHVLIATMRPASGSALCGGPMGVASKFHCTI